MASQVARKASWVWRSRVLLGVEPLWRYMLNGQSTREFKRSSVQLRPEARRVLADLERDGVARSTLEELTGDPTLLGRLQAEAARLEQERADQLAEAARSLDETTDLGHGNQKIFVVLLLDPERPVIDPDGLLASTAINAQVKGIADAYFGLRTKVADLNVWRTLPSPHAPVASQLWHRDLPEDRLVLKTFIYLEDVVEGAGPFSYIKGTHGRGDRHWKPSGTTHDGFNWRASHDVMEQATEAERRPVFTAPAGTVLFADTIGWHKGGQATTTPRLVIQTLYASRAATNNRQLGIPAGVDPSSLPSDLAFDLSTAG